jgi:hypothetical protein
MVTVRLATLFALWLLKKPSPESLQIQRLSTTSRLGAVHTRATGPLPSLGVQLS